MYDVISIRNKLSICFIFMVLVGCSSSSWQSNKHVSQEIEKIYADPRLANSTTSLIVREMDSGNIIYEQNPDKSLIPASGLKLVTSTAALDLLGADYRFKTQLMVTGFKKNNTLYGNVILHGEGDPYIDIQDYYKLFSFLGDQEIAYVSGSFIIDDSWFDNNLLGDGWEQNDESEYYSAPISSIMFSAEQAPSVTVSVTADLPYSDGNHTNVSMSPKNNSLRLVNESIVCNKKDEDLNIRRLHGTNDILIDGCLNNKKTSLVTVPNPKSFISSLSINYLKNNQIKFGDKSFSSADIKVVAMRSSPELIEMYRRFLKKSDNVMAESLVKTIGKKYRQQGASASGLSVINDYLKSEAIYSQGIKMVDGSGLSRKNYITTGFITDLLLHNSKKMWFTQWRDSLPKVVGGHFPAQAADEQGTLKGRLKNLPDGITVYAKTGSMSGISSISGYICNKYNKCYTFSFIENNFIGSIKDIEDSAITVLSKRLNELD